VVSDLLWVNRSLKKQKLEESELDPWTLFLNAMRAPMTRDRYQTRVAKFLDFIGMRGRNLEQKATSFAKKGKENTNWALSNILKFVYFQRERVDKKEISGATVINYTKSIKLFCEMADIPIPWKKITRGLPRGKRYADDRIPTLEELKKLVEYPDRRIKAIVYTMASSGIRVGAWNYLRWSHIRPIEKNGELIAAKMIVYGGEDDEYFTFISASAWSELMAWKQYRESSGEPLNGDSWVMRNLWDTRVAQGRGLVTVPKKLTSLGVKRLMERAIWAQGLRKKLDPGKKRHPFQANHSLRKWFKTRCEIASMKPINIEKLLNHSVGISDSYYRATEQELLEDYLHAIEYLSINGNETKLTKEIEELREKSKENEYVITGKLHEKDKQILKLERKQEKFEQFIQSLIDSGQIKERNQENRS
jgi:integrase